MIAVIRAVGFGSGSECYESLSYYRLIIEIGSGRGDYRGLHYVAYCSPCRGRVACVVCP